MTLNLWLAYIGIIGALIFLPGPSALLCISHGLKYGNVKTIATVFGGAIASLSLMSISIIGLGAILAASEEAFLIIKLLGAAYLIYLGITSWNKSPHQVLSKSQTIKSPKNASYPLLYKGFMVGISNPKDLLFFAALFPNFINIELPLFEQYLTLAITWLIIDFIAMYLYASVGSKISPWFSSPKNLQLFNRTSGSIYLSIGGSLAISSALNEKV